MVKLIVGKNDLETWCNNNGMRHILDEWDYKKNQISPCDVTKGSGKRIFWKCKKGHEWETDVYHRTTRKTNCPLCNKSQTSFPEQAIAFYLSKEYNIQKRNKIDGYEVDIFLPDYKIAIEYDGRYFHKNAETKKRDSKKTEHITKKGIKLFRIIETENEISSYDSTIMFPASHGKYCTKEFKWAIEILVSMVNKETNKASCIDIDVERDELSIRAFYLSSQIEGSVAKVYPEICSEWDYEKNLGVGPESFSAHNGNKIWWKCKNGHSWYASINSRTRYELGCPFCAGQMTIYGNNDLETWCINNNAVHILNEWNSDKNQKSPSEYQRTSNKKVWWKCKEGHEWEASITNRVHGTGCPVCNAPKGIKKKQESLSQWCVRTGNTHLIDEWNEDKNSDKNMDDYSHGSHAIVWWKCKEGHEWEAQIKSRTYNHGCPYCSPNSKKVIKGVNDLETWCKNNGKGDLLDEWDYEKNDANPDTYSKGSHAVVWWKCRMGHTWKHMIKERTKLNGNRCPFCKKEERENI